MASPSVTAQQEGFVSPAGTDHEVAWTDQAGLVVVFVATANSVTLTSYIGLTQLEPASGTARFHIFYGDSSSAGSDPLTSSASTKSAWVTLNITGQHASTAPEKGTLATGTSNAPNSPSLTASGGSKDYLWLAGFSQAGEEADDDDWQNNTPTGTGGGSYSPSLGYQKTTGTDGTAATNRSLCVAYRAYTGDTEDPSVWSTDQSLAWLAQTVVIYPAALTLTRDIAVSIVLSPSEVKSVGKAISSSIKLLPATTKGVVKQCAVAVALTTTRALSLARAIAVDLLLTPILTFGRHLTVSVAIALSTSKTTSIARQIAAVLGLTPSAEKHKYTSWPGPDPGTGTGEKVILP